MAAPFFQAILKNLPTIISVGTGLYSLFTKTAASKQESDRVVQAFELLRNHRDDVDRFLADPERQRILMEGYSILLRRVQELERDRRTGTGAWGQREPWRDEGYGWRQIGYHDRDDGYRTKGDFIIDFRGGDDYGWRNNYHGRDDFRDVDRRQYERRRDEPREDLWRRRQDRPRQNGAEHQRKPSKGKTSGGGGVSPKIKSQLVCDVCRERYNSNLRRPTLLPTCGHTFCRACLREVSRREHLRCPVCRSDPFMDVASLPTNRPILDMVIENENSDGGESSEDDGVCSSSEGPSCRSNAPSCRNDNPSCGNDIPSCGNDNPSCGNDNPSCRNGSSGWEDDSGTFTMMSYEEQIQLAIIWSREEMRRTDKNDSTPFAFLDDAERESEELAQAMSLSLLETQNNGQHSVSEEEACGISHCLEMNVEDEEEHINLAIQMSLETFNNSKSGETNGSTTQEEELRSMDEFLAQQAAIAEKEFKQALHCSMQEYQLAREPHFASAPRVEEEVQCRSNPMEEHGRWREREKEKLEKEREELKKEREALEKQKEEWRKKTEKEENQERARQTLTSLGCFGGDQHKKSGEDSCKEDSDDDDCFKDDCFKDDNCFRDNDCSTDDDDDVCCGNSEDSKKKNCTESEDECCEDDNICCASTAELSFGKDAADCKKGDDTVNSSLWWQEKEERERRRRKKRDWIRKKEEEQLQLAMAMSLSLHEAEALQPSQSVSE